MTNITHQMITCICTIYTHHVQLKEFLKSTLLSGERYAQVQVNNLKVNMYY